MAIFKDDRAYNPKTLTRVFLWSSLALLVSVLWMAFDDYYRPWKNYQRQFMKMERIKARKALKEAASALDKEKFKELSSAMKEAKAGLKAQRKEIGSLESKVASLDGKIYKVNQKYQFTKAEIDAAKFAYEETYAKTGKAGKKAALKALARIAKLEKAAEDYSQKKLGFENQQGEANAKLDEIYAQRDRVQENLVALTKEKDFLTDRVEGLREDGLFFFRNAPFLDFMSPTLTIKQVILENIPEDLYFSKTMRVDRCTTCHLAIDKKGYEDAKQPFKTHPKLDLFLGSTSSHPIDKIGCTVCHGGVGQALDFQMTAHMPNSEEQAKKWKKNHGWHKPHGIDTPMVALKYTEGSCLKCHGPQQHVNHAPKLNRGRELMVTQGCVGCHKVAALEGLAKAGPSLLKVKGKLDREFVEKWVWDPKSFNAHARMPGFFNQSNNSDAESMEFAKAELKALVDLLYEGSQGYDPQESHPGGSISQGKKLFKEVGCLACHGIDDAAPFRQDFGPDLSSTGSKLSADFVYTWVRNPRHYDPSTRMPSLRLTSQEAADITSYLMSKKNEDFEKIEPPQATEAARDSMVTDYLKPQFGPEGAKAEMAKMDGKAKDHFLAGKTMTKYGCFGCHTIAGYEKTPGIGTELTEWGSKRVAKLDFGIQKLDHNLSAFLNAKLENPRVFDHGKVKAFGDKLKMPKFNLDEKDREALATAVLGLTGTYVPEEMMAGVRGNGPLLEKGRRVLAEFNCRGCHLVEDQGGDIQAFYNQEGRDISMAPPDLRKQGYKVQVDWFHGFLTGVKPIRPWLNIRMPNFHWDDRRLSEVISYFNLKEDQVFPFDTAKPRRLEGEDLIQAKTLFSKLQCQKCHVLGGQIPPDLSSAAPDLLKVRGRLKPEWVADWLKNPEALMPGTRMPGFWPDGAAADPKAFGGDGQKQREALRDYLFMLGN